MTPDQEIAMLREKLADALAGGMQHKSDCATSNAPAYEPGPCDCGAGTLADKYRGLLDGVMIQFRHRGCECTFPSEKCCGYAEADTFLSARAKATDGDAA